jgi:hypothetical protein
MPQTMEAGSPVAAGTVAWMLYKNPNAGVHLTDDAETRDRWIGDYGAASVFPLLVGKEDEKPFAWRHRRKGLRTWYFHIGETFVPPVPEDHEYAPLYLSATWHTFKLEKSFAALVQAAENIVAIDHEKELRTSSDVSVSGEMEALRAALDQFKAVRQMLQAAD